MAEDSKWISNAISRPGRLTAAAKRAGQSVSEYAAAHKHDPKGSIGDAARMYENVLKPASKSRSTHSAEPGNPGTPFARPNPPEPVVRVPAAPPTPEQPVEEDNRHWAQAGGVGKDLHTPSDHMAGDGKGHWSKHRQILPLIELI